MKTTCLFAVLVAGTISGSLQADDDLNQNEIHNLVRQGKILSLEAILERYPQETHGKLLDLEVQREHGIVVYELEFLRRDNTVVELEINAATGELISKEIED